jgi:phosphate transport system substrate-binding protein
VAAAAPNPGLTLSPAPNYVVHRSDGSGTTHIFGSYLSSTDPAWAAKVGIGEALSWPARRAPRQRRGGLRRLPHPFAVGYVEQAKACGIQMP